MLYISVKFYGLIKHFFSYLLWKAADKIKLRMKVASILTSGVHSGQTDSSKGTR